MTNLAVILFQPSIVTNDVKLNVLYSDKFVLQTHKPTLSSFVNTPINGFFALSASGILLYIFLSLVKYLCKNKINVVFFSNYIITIVYKWEGDHSASKDCNVVCRSKINYDC